MNHIKLIRNTATEYLNFDERIDVIEKLSKDLKRDLIKYFSDE